MDSLFSIMKARGLMAAVSLGIFDALAGDSKSAPQLAHELHLDPTSLDLLLRCMVWSGYLQQSGDRYTLSQLSRDTMIHQSKMDLRAFVQWNYVQWRMVEQLEQVLKTGRGADFHSTMTDPNEWGWYQEAMLEIARFDAPLLARGVPVRPGARNLLDLAGSHGLLGAAICRKHPPMCSTVIDLSSAVEHARALSIKEGIADIVKYRPGDIRTADLGRDNDVVLLANILHHFLPEQNSETLRRVRSCVSIDGTIAIWELETPDPQSKPSEGDGAALFFRLTSSALCYSGKQYAAWLRDAGFERIRVVRPRFRPGYILVTGRTAK
jgi:2-polyprenyl-3-methyl-5-hydroxy-6-metoxy-1,4-benzoquinol methylase